MRGRMEIIYTRSMTHLAQLISENLRLSRYSDNVCKFSNEILVSVPKKFHEVIVLSSTVSHDDWIELILLLDALKEAKRIILCLSFMGYARQDKYESEVSSGFRVLSHLIEAENISHFIIVDNHCDLVFKKPSLNLSIATLFETDILQNHKDADIIISPDLGGAKKAQRIAKALKCDFGLCIKNRNIFGILKESELIAGNVEGKNCILVDDIIDSGATVVEAAKELHKKGAKSITAYASHGLLNERSLDRIEKSDIIELVLTDSISRDSIRCKKIRRISVALLISDVIKDILTT